MCHHRFTVLLAIFCTVAAAAGLDMTVNNGWVMYDDGGSAVPGAQLYS
jgi:hypothetical protein